MNTKTETTTRAAVSERDARRRQALIHGLRELAQFLDEHPGVPFEYADLLYHVPGEQDEQGIARVHEVARLLGVEVTINDDGSHFYAGRSFGPVTYRAAYIRRQAMADHNAHMSYRTNVRAGERAA